MPVVPRLPIQLRFPEWLDRVESIISNSIAERRDDWDWDENAISMSWIEALRKELPLFHIVSRQLQPFAVAWNAYKIRGSVEKGHGDIAFLVQCDFAPRPAIIGVGFLEAKRFWPENGEYSMLDHTQLARQSAATANHQLLLYDKEHIQNAVENLETLGYCGACNIYNRAVRAAVIPTPHALAFGAQDRALHRLCIPLSFQICCRYLRGFDLDWNDNTVSKVLRGEWRIPYIVTARATFSPIASVTPEPMRINLDHFVPIGRNDGEQDSERRGS